MGELRGVAGELLAQRQRRRVLQVRAADLDDVGESGGLGRQRAPRAWSATAAGRGKRFRAAATFIAVGNTSLDDWPRLTSSLGCTRRPSPRAPPSNSEARLASTSLTFMLVCVPEPVCQTASGNSSAWPPASASSAAAMMASAFFASSSAERDVDARGAALDDQQRADQRRRHLFASRCGNARGSAASARPTAGRRERRSGRRCRARCASALQSSWPPNARRGREAPSRFRFLERRGVRRPESPALPPARQPGPLSALRLRRRPSSTGARGPFRPPRAP